MGPHRRAKLIALALAPFSWAIVASCSIPELDETGLTCTDRCSGRLQCIDGRCRAAAADGGSGSDGDQPDARVDAASCAGGANQNCGTLGTDDCCASVVVPGGTYARSSDPRFPATVSDFRLDRYEITVGRFRAFVDAGRGTQASPPAAGSGAHPGIAGSGWDPAWNANLPPSTSAFDTHLACTTTRTWTDAPGPNEDKPINCITWYDAFAFCAWDGGRLPTETEWNYAAMGGSEQREYPWSNPPSSTQIDGSYAVYSPSASAPAPVGSKSPKGDGKWGHADLTGNVWEWALDTYADPYRNPCTDCANPSPATDRLLQGKSFVNVESAMPLKYRYHVLPTTNHPDMGGRCARSR